MIMMAAPPPPHLECLEKVRIYENLFKNKSDDELVNLYKELYNQHKDDKTPFSYAFVPDGWNQAKAAVDLLRDRHGEEYIEKLTGVKQPKTIIGKILRSLI